MAVPPASSNDLVQMIRKSELVESRSLDQFLSQHPSAHSPLQLAKKFVEADLITSFQAEQLLQGRTRGFDLGNYRVRKPLGGGATGVVFLCENRMLKTLVAVKVLSSNLLQQDDKSLQRFRREARAASLLEHPNIIRTLDIDEDEGRHFLVMEFVEGTSLEELRKSQPTLPIKDVVDYAIQTLHGMQHIADAGLVHRDIKPGNLLLDKQGTIKILDLGLARFTNDCDDNLTVQQGVDILGTVDFMAPEQGLDGSAVDHRADIYSLGATIYFLLTGKTPLPDGPTTSKILAAQFHTPTRMSAIRPEIDPGLEEIVGKMMAKKLANRYQQPSKVIEALVEWQKIAARKVPVKPIAPRPAPKATTVDPSPVRSVAPTLAPPRPNASVSAPPMPRAPKPKLAPVAEEILEGEVVDEPAELTALVSERNLPSGSVGRRHPLRDPSPGKWHVVAVIVLGVTLGVLGLLLK